MRRYEPTDCQAGMLEHPDGDYVNVRDLVDKLKELQKSADDEAHANYDEESHGQSSAYITILKLLGEK